MKSAKECERECVFVCVLFVAWKANVTKSKVHEKGYKTGMRDSSKVSLQSHHEAAPMHDRLKWWMQKPHRSTRKLTNLVLYKLQTENAFETLT